MPEVVVSRVTADQWEAYRAVRLAMLAQSPRAFGMTYAEALARDEQGWRERVGSPTWFAHVGAPPPTVDAVLGSVSTFHFPEQPEAETCVTGMWVRPDARGAGVGERLLDAVREGALADGRSRLTLDVAKENTSARRCYERFGFTPTGRSGVLPNDPTVAELEMALDLRT